MNVSGAMKMVVIAAISMAQEWVRGQIRGGVQERMGGKKRLYIRGIIHTGFGGCFFAVKVDV